MKKLLFILLISTLAVSCGQKGESSKAKFKIFSGNLTNTQAAFTGGLLVMGRSVDGLQSFTIAYQPGLELELKKGGWEFATIGWMGINPLEGNQKCSYQALDINSDFFTVNFNMNNQNCSSLSSLEGKRFSHPMFYNLIGGTYNGFKKLSVKTCPNLETDCSSSQEAPTSYRVEIPPTLKGITSSTAVAASLVSSCISGTPDSNITPPYGGPNGFIGTKISTYKAARFSYPEGVTISSGNIYVADTVNSTIRKITLGEVSTLAGNAQEVGDNVDATGSAARLNYPSSVAVDSSGNTYVADRANHTIRKITSVGEVTTFAGTAGSLGSINATGVAAKFSGPSGVALDSSGNLYVADMNNHTIRKITPAGVVTTLAGLAGSSGSANGTTPARFNYPTGVAVDSSGNVYVADAGNNIIRKITPAGAVSTFAGTAGSPGDTDSSTAALAKFNTPKGLAVDSSGNVYVADTGNYTIRKITPAGVVSTLAGTTGIAGNINGLGIAARFNIPKGVAVDSLGNVYVADAGNNNIRKITSVGLVTTLAGSTAVNPLMGSADGTASDAGCMGMPKNYFFNHGFGEVLYSSENGASVLKGALSVDANSSDASIALTPFLGVHTDPSTSPSSTSGIKALYLYQGVGLMSVDPVDATGGQYLYYDGSSWSAFSETDSVKLLLKN